MIPSMIEGTAARRGWVASESNDNGAASRARALFLVAWAFLLVLKLGLASALALFGDEAFYWQESGALAAGYSDVPLLTAALIRLGTEVAGTSELGVRWPFLALGALLPWVVVAWARCIVPARDAWCAGALALALPLAALLGVFALPDVPLTLAIVAAAPLLERARTHDRWRDWLACAAVLALGWLSHYRFAMFYVAGAVFLLATPAGRALLARPKFWAVQVLGLAGLVPSLVYDLGNEFAALSFQFVDRHAWSFDLRAATEPIVQALVTTPVLFAACAVAMFRGARSPAPAHAALGALAGGLLTGWLVIGLFADVERSRFHWPLPAYLLALPLVPAVLRGWSRTRLGATLVTAGVLLGVAATLGYAALLAYGARTTLAHAPGAWLTDNTRGWRAVGAWVERLAGGREAPLVADNFLLGAEIDFARRGIAPVYVLDHPANVKHGRAAQLATWARDERALEALPWTRAVLVVEETSRRPAERLAAYRALCERFGAMRLRDELRLERGRAVFVAFDVAKGRGAAPCELPAFAYIDAPAPGARVDAGALAVHGWALRERAGVARVDLVVDGEVRATARYGGTRTDVAAFWPDAEDPALPNVGFDGSLPVEGLADGEHVLAVRVTGRDGRVRTVAEQVFVVAR